LREGYAEWVNKNRSDLKKLSERFREFGHSHVAVQRHMARSPNSKDAPSLDSVLATSGLTASQINRIKEIPEVVEESDSLEELESKLDHFDRETIDSFDKASRKVILQYSALVRAQFRFLEELTTSLPRDSTVSKSFSPKDDPCVAGPRPKWRNYYNAPGVFNGGLTGGSVGGTVGSGVCALSGAGTVVTPLCGFAGGMGGFVVGATTKYMEQVERFRNYLAPWCNAPGCTAPACAKLDLI
jgi:hypothetical protein